MKFENFVFLIMWIGLIWYYPSLWTILLPIWISVGCLAVLVIIGALIAFLELINWICKKVSR